MSDPFRTLGVRPDAGEAEIRRAWRTAIKAAHPDAGGTTAQVDALSVALAEALARRRTGGHHRDGLRRDVPSFTVECLPAEAHEALLVAVGGLGPPDAEIVDSDPPYLLEFMLRAGLDGLPDDTWCRCELLPEAGASTVLLSVDGADPVTVRDLLVGAVNALDWGDVSDR